MSDRYHRPGTSFAALRDKRIKRRRLQPSKEAMRELLAGLNLKPLPNAPVAVAEGAYGSSKPFAHLGKREAKRPRWK